LHHISGEGADFKLLGVTVDVRLIMASAVSAINKKARPKLRALLRTMPYYTRSQLVQSYKAHVLSILEGATGAIYHASLTVLQPLDQTQGRFVRHVGLNERSAFLDYNLAPLGLRRDIAMLGLVYRCAHGQAHEPLCKLFPRSTVARHVHGTRLASALHTVQIEETWESVHLDTARRSLLGLARVWNLLPTDVVQKPSVSSFQSALTNMARHLCKDGYPRWHVRSSPRSPYSVRIA